MLRKLERKLGRFAIPNLILFLVGGQTATLVLALAKPEFLSKIPLSPAHVLGGEVWRLVSFIFFPPSVTAGSSLSLFLALIGIYVTYLFGQALQGAWGDFKFNAFIFSWWLFTVATSFAFPLVPVTNVSLIYVIGFAFAYQFPDYELLLMFILPVKAKWLGILAAVLMIFGLADAPLPIVAVAFAGVIPFFLFCGPDMVRRLRGQRRRDRVARQVEKAETAVRHTCTTCGRTDQSHPELQFRYCSKCSGSHAYCMDHLRDHEHV